MTSTKETVLAYIAAVEAHDLERVATHLHPDVQVVERQEQYDCFVP